MSNALTKNKIRFIIQTMGKFFNIAGPCDPKRHYMLPPQDRCPGLHSLIEQGLYFVIHAARQTGKTTLLQNMASELDSKGDYHTVYCSLEVLQGIGDYEKGIPPLVRKLASEAVLTPGLENHRLLEGINLQDPANAVNQALRSLAGKAAKPVIIFFDEADCLSNGTLISFLRQLRDGYINRARVPFIHSIALVGMRNIRDFKARIRDESETLGSASPFNIVTEALTLRNFSKDEIAAFYGQHTDATGQAFEPSAIQRVVEQTCGQPWLVNAIARECVEKLLNGDFSRAVTVALVDQAIQNIILRRDTHIDSLLERLKEKRVRQIVAPVLVGDERRFSPLDEDYQYAIDLGLLKESEQGLTAANPIYAEVIVRMLSWQAQLRLDDMKHPSCLARYLVENRLDMNLLLGEFQEFWRGNAEMMGDASSYAEAVPHLVLQAFLQRVLNGGGNISREFAVGRLRMDLLVEFGGQKYALEIKLWRGEKTLEEGKTQLSAYLDRVGQKEGWLVIFDRNPARAWDEKISWKTETMAEGKTLHLVGC